MAAPSLGSRAGSMHVRVLPDTTGFRRDLRRKIEQIERTMPPLEIEVSRARVQRERIKQSINKQLRELGDFDVRVDVDANVRNATQKIKDLQHDRKVKLLPSIDEVFLSRVQRQIERAVRDIEPTIRILADDDDVRWRVDSLQNEFKKLERDLLISVLSAEEAARIRQRINQISDELDDMAEDRTVRVDINPFTAWASARLAWLTRPRTVEIIPKVSQAALMKVATALAALSGTRLSYDYMKRFSDWMSEIDKKLPRLTFGVSGLTTAFSALMGSVAGIVGIGDGLAATLPSLLLLPGLFAGAAMSGIALYVAMKDAKSELDELGDSYTNLGKIISRNYWAEARQPIIDFSNSIMPQLERSFEKTSLAMGRFTAQLMGDFQKHFANGRLEAMFDGLAASWDELSKGTDAFAGAITNLGLVAARYMPRLASWFVRQADTFDNWLSEVATDGRLDQWIEESIDAFYALWDVMAATTGIFQGIWKAAEAAGYEGLRGFADMLLRWEESVNGMRWQRTLTSMFRGARDAMSGLGEGFERFGLMLDRQRDAIEYFMATAGEALGGFLGDLSDAFSSPAVARGMTDFIDGIKSGLEGLQPAMEPVAELIGEIAGLAGDMADEFGPLLGQIGSDLAPNLTDFFAGLRDEIPGLVDTAEAIWENLEPALADVLDAVKDLTPAVADLVSVLGPLSEALEPLRWLFNNTGAGNAADNFRAISSFFEGFDEGGIVEATGRFREELEASETAMHNFMLVLSDWALGIGLEIGKAKWGLEVFSSSLITAGAEAITGFLRGITQGFVAVVAWFAALPAKIDAFFSWAVTLLVSRGVQLLAGLRNGAVQGFVTVAVWIASVPGQIASFFAGAGSWLVASGRALMQGFAQGVLGGIASAKSAVASAVAELRGLFPNSPAKWGPFSGSGWVDRSGIAVGTVFSDSIVKSLDRGRSNVSRSLSGFRSEFTSLTNDFDGISLGVAASFANDRANASRATRHMVPPKNEIRQPSSSTNVTANFIQPEQREQFREFTAMVKRALR